MLLIDNFKTNDGKITFSDNVESILQGLKDRIRCNNSRNLDNAQQQILQFYALGNHSTGLLFSLLVLGIIPELPLPDDWIAVYHESGGIVYLHKKSRVVTWSRPYYIGNGSLRAGFLFLYISIFHLLSSFL